MVHIKLNRFYTPGGSFSGPWVSAPRCVLYCESMLVYSLTHTVRHKGVKDKGQRTRWVQPRSHMTWRFSFNESLYPDWVELESIYIEGYSI